MYVLLLVGFLLLIKGADYFVEGSSSIAKLLRVPTVVIGLTVVALGTSMPEMAVSVTAAMTGNNDIAVSNVLGSNLFNLLVVVGACGVVVALPVDKTILKRDFPFSIGVTLLLLGMCAFDLKVSRGEGMVLFGILIGYLLYIIRSALKHREPELEEAIREKEAELEEIWSGDPYGQFLAQQVDEDGCVTILDLHTGGRVKLEGITVAQGQRCYLKANPSQTKLLWAEWDGGANLSRLGVVDLERGVFTAFARENLDIQYNDVTFWMGDNRVAVMMDLHTGEPYDSYSTSEYYLCVYEF